MVIKGVHEVDWRNMMSNRCGRNCVRGDTRPRMPRSSCVSFMRRTVPRSLPSRDIGQLLRSRLYDLLLPLRSQVIAGHESTDSTIKLLTSLDGGGTVGRC